MQLSTRLLRTLLAATIALSGIGAPATRAAESKPAPGANCTADSGWDDATEPFRLFGNTWFVGTCGVSAVLVTSPRGHVLLDGTTEKSALRVAENIGKLGFRLRDVRYLLVSHSHNDHVGGVRELAQRTGAIVVSRGADAAALERGRGDRSDPQFDLAMTFPAIASARRIVDGESIRVGALVVTAHATPGHTPGSTSWTWRSCERARCLDMVYADSLSAIADDTYRYSDAIANPGAVDAFRTSITVVAALPCDVLVTTHPASSQMWLRTQAGGVVKLIDPQACKRYAEFARQALNVRVAKEAGR